MDLWFVIKERYQLLSVLIIVLLVNGLLLFAVWKNRPNLPRKFIALVMMLCLVIIALVVIALGLALSIGYNA